jgi:hypothetical protein
MINVGLFIKKDKVFDSGTNGIDNVNEFIIDDNHVWITEQWVNYLIRIVAGTGQGYYFKCTSNTDNALNFDPLPFTLDTTSQYEIYTQVSERVELFQDEKISVTSSIQNSNDIGKLFTDYSQSFTVPASKHNNALFSHWYESDVDNGYDHRKRYDAYIELDTLTFKVGNVQLEKANKKNGFIESYSITFYGNLTQLKDKFKDTKLRDLQTGVFAAFFGTDNFWNLFNHEYNSTEVRDRVTGYTTFAVYYPLIGSQKKYYYKNGIATEDISLTTAPIVWNELFPAVPISAVFQFIQWCFGVTFTGSFFELDQWTKLHLYLKNAEILKVQTEISNVLFSSKSSGFDEMNLSAETLTTNWNFGTSNVTKYIIPNLIITTASTVPYTIYVYRNDLLFATFSNIVGTQSLRIDYLININSSNSINYAYNFKIISDSVISFDTQLNYMFQYFNGTNYVTNYKYAYNTAQSTTANIQLQNYVPDITVSDFITGIIKAFNLMIIPTGIDTYEFIPLEMFYNSGKITDITKFVDANELDIERPKLFKAINFQYEQSTNVLNNAYKGIYGKEYGDLIYNATNANESSNYDIKLPFENVMFEKTVGENFETASIIDKDLKPYVPKPMLIYRNGSQQIDSSNLIRITTESGQTTILNYNRFSNEYNSLPTDATLSQLMTMNFNNEQSPWYNVIAPQGLYYRHYSNYIDNLYNIKTRNIKVKAILPPSLLSKEYGIALNDRLVISGKRYIINSFTTDLTNGETNFDLISDYRNINAVSTVGYRFSSMSNVQTDKTEQKVNIVIYKNDYDSFDIKGPENYLSYTTSTDNITDLNLEIDIPENFGVDRTDVIGIDYYKNGISQTIEYVTFLQTEI